MKCMIEVEASKDKFLANVKDTHRILMTKFDRYKYLDYSVAGVCVRIGNGKPAAVMIRTSTGPDGEIQAFLSITSSSFAEAIYLIADVIEAIGKELRSLLHSSSCCALEADIDFPKGYPSILNWEIQPMQQVA